MDRSTVVNDSRQGAFSEESYNTPGFHALRLNGSALPSKPYTWMREDWDTPPSWASPEDGRYWTDYTIGGRYSWLDALRSGKDRQGIPINSLQLLSDRLSVRVNRKIRETDIDLGIALGERKETAQLFEHTINRVVRMWQSIRRRDPSGALRDFTGLKNNKLSDVPKVASDLWLEFTFGVTPVVNDLYKAADVISKSTKPFVEVGRVVTTDQLDVSCGNTYIYTGGQFDRWEASGTLSGRAVVEYKVTNPWLAVADRAGLTNPLLIAWQLQPLSFVVDWFLPIGQIISNVVPPQGIAVTKAWMTIKGHGSVSRTNNFFINDAKSGLILKSVTGSSREVYKRRAPFSPLSVPLSGYKTGGIDSAGKVASSLALLWQKLH